MVLLKRPPNLHIQLPDQTIKKQKLNIPNSFNKSLIKNIKSSTQEVACFSNLEKIQVLGSGSSATVYKVRDKQTSLVYALKVVRGGHPDKEIEILRSINSPFIVGCHGVFQETIGEVGILLEYMEGGSLDNLVKGNGSFPEAVIGRIAFQVLTGLDYLHARKIVHCDIKPANLLIDKHMNVKIGDFGVSSKITGLEDPCKTYAGTCAYMGPERYDPYTYGGKAFAGDVWSLGLTLMEMYIGYYPYLKPGQKEESTALMFEICMEEPPSLPDHASESFRDFTQCCLQKESAKRWSACQLLSHPFVLSGRSKWSSN